MTILHFNGLTHWMKVMVWKGDGDRQKAGGFPEFLRDGCVMELGTEQILCGQAGLQSRNGFYPADRFYTV